MSEANIQPFDSFTTVYKVLGWLGYYKLLKKPENNFKWLCHQLYRPVSLLVILVYNLQHIIFIVQRRDNIDDIFDCLMIEIPQLNLLVKYLTMNLQISRLDDLNKLISGPMFGATSKEDVKVILKHTTFMNRLYKAIIIYTSISGLFWHLSHFFRRYQDPNAVMPVYVPFDTDTWSKFSISVIIQIVLHPWVGYGHLSFDFIVAAYYAQAEVQLKVIKYNLEHMFKDKMVAKGAIFRYRDEIDTNLKGRFVYYVKRFERVAWYTKKVDSVFSPTMFFQFFTSSATLGCLVCRLSFVPVGTVLFVFLIILFLLVSTQVFLYCYFGTLVHYESESLVTSLYLSDWYSLSPKFRRLLLIAMSNWSREITPLVSGLIPLSLNTFITILKSAYSLYTVMATTN